MFEKLKSWKIRWKTFTKNFNCEREKEMRKWLREREREQTSRNIKTRNKTKENYILTSKLICKMSKRRGEPKFNYNIIWFKVISASALEVDDIGVNDSPSVSKQSRGTDLMHVMQVCRWSLSVRYGRSLDLIECTMYLFARGVLFPILFYFFGGGGGEALWKLIH